MPPAAKATVAAPPSPDYDRRSRVARVKVNKGKGNRSAAETAQLIDDLTALLPPGTLGP